MQGKKVFQEKLFRINPKSWGGIYFKKIFFVKKRKSFGRIFRSYKNDFT